MRKGSEQGIFFCAKVGERTYLRFVHAEANWTIKTAVSQQNDGTEGENIPLIDHEIGRCLRLIECSENEEAVIEDNVQDAAYDLWLVARQNIYQHWTYETDPANLQPKVRPLNRKVADFVRENIPVDIEQSQLDRALDILESPWPRRDEGRLRKWFAQELKGKELSAFLTKKVLDSGLEPFIAPEPLPPIKEDDIELLVWMGITVDN